MRGAWSIAALQIAIAGERPKRKIRRVAVIAEKEDARKSDRSEPVLVPSRPVTGRGGQYTYHGPGQRVAYVMLDLKARGGDIRAYVASLETWLITTLAAFDIRGERRDGRVGVWVVDGDREFKIAAVGVRVRRWVSYHGVSLNVAPDLDHYQGIVSCGIRDHGVTSLAGLGVDATMDEVDSVLRKTFEALF